jgi:hypothetical protein
VAKGRAEKQIQRSEDVWENRQKASLACLVLFKNDWIGRKYFFPH